MVWGKHLYVSIGLRHGSPCTCIGSHLFYVQKKIGAPYGLTLRWIRLHCRYVSSCLHTSAYFSGDKQYYLGLGGWASRTSKVMSCVTQSKGRKTGSVNTSENSSNKAEIHRSLAPRTRGVQGPPCCPSSRSLAPITRRLPNGCNNVNQAAHWDLHMVFIEECKDHSST